MVILCRRQGSCNAQPLQSLHGGHNAGTSSFGNHIEPFGSLASLFKQTEKASSPWTTGNLWRRGCDRKETAPSSWRFWRAAASGCEARIGAAYAAGVWSSAPLRPRPPIATGSFACLHTLSTYRDAKDSGQVFPGDPIKLLQLLLKPCCVNSPEEEGELRESRAAM